jgi:hypothetical protein
MSINQFKSVEERVKNFRLYYQKKNERPLLGFYTGSEYPLYRYKAAKTLPEHQPLKPEDFCVEEYLDDCDRLFDEHEACGGDFIWSASAFWGVPWLEAALGCNLIADHSTGSIHTESPESFNGISSIPEFDKQSPWMKKTVEFLGEMAERSKGRWPIGTTRMRGISDLLSALYRGENFIYAMLEKPDEVKDVCKKLTDFWIEYGKLQLENIPLFHDGIGSFYYNMWVPAGTVWHQEDAAALMSPSLYEEFIRSCDERIAGSFPGCIIHQHPAGFYPVDAYLEMDMLALELHIDEGGPSAEELYNVHKKIMDKKPLVIWGDIPEKDLDWIFGNLQPEGLAVNVVVESKEQAKELWNKYIAK